VLGESNQTQGIKAIIDTGYTGFLTLPSAIITTLELTWFMQEEGFLGDGSLCMFNVFEAAVIWDGQIKPIELFCYLSDKYWAENRGESRCRSQVRTIHLGDRTSTQSGRSPVL
jgi:hypothetical protein